MSNPLKPHLPAAGQICMSQLANEFQIPPVDIYLSNYKRGGNIVKNTWTNRNVPGVVGVVAPNTPSSPLCLTKFYNASHFLLSVQFDGDAETTHKYGWNNDGKIRVKVWGVSDDFSVSIKGKGVDSVFRYVGGTGPQVFSSVTDGGVIAFPKLNSGNYTITVIDNDNHVNNPSYINPPTFNVTVKYGTGAGISVQGFSTGTRHYIELPGSPASPPPNPPMPTPVPILPGLETFAQIKLVTFGGDDLMDF